MSKTLSLRSSRPDTKLGNKRRKKKKSSARQLSSFFLRYFSTLHNAKVYSFVYIKTNSARPILSITYCQPELLTFHSLEQANPKK